MPITLKDYDTKAKPDWCPGCGDFAIQVAVKQALVNLQIEPHKVAIVSDIGCGGKIAHWVNCYGLHSLHGRAIPAATGVKFSNRDLTVICDAGDGGAYGIGMGHFIHAMRRNIDMVYLVHNNGVYGLTKGQMTPTSQKGYVSPSSPFGAIETPVNPMMIALSSGCGFVARGSSGDAVHLTKIIEEGIKHKGFALIDIFQPCVTYNKVNTYAYYLQHTYNLDKDEKYDRSDWNSALKVAVESEKMPVGILYQKNLPIYEDQDPGRAELAAVNLNIENINIDNVIKKYY